MSDTRPDYVKDLYQRWGATSAEWGELPLDEWRATIEEWPQVTAEPGGVDYVEVDADGVPAMWVAPKGATEDRVVLGLHGGGFVTGSMYTHRKLFGHLAKTIGTRALVPDYRRPPEHTHPAPVQDALSGDTGKPQDPLVSPLHADQAGLPPLFIQASRDEVPVDDSRSFVEWAHQAGVEARLDLFPDQQHTFQMAAGRSPEADDAIRRLAEWASPKLGL